MPKHYKILLSAYACEPNQGSEPGVGWNWSLEVARRGHDVWVLTRQNNQKSIEKFFIQNDKPENLNFIYYDLNSFFLKVKKWPLGLHIYYFFWQLGIIRIAKSCHKHIQFDIVHHITFVSIHQPSFLFLLKGPRFVYGPAAGGDLVPIKFLNDFPIKKSVKEYLIYLTNYILHVDPIRRYMLRKSELIFVNSVNTRAFIPKKFHNKTVVNLAIGVSEIKDFAECEVRSKESNLKLIYVGKFFHWKGLHLVLKAVEQLNNTSEQVELTLIGKGDFNFNQYNIDKIEVVNWISQEELFNMYHQYDIMIFPSFRDSGGMVVLEALRCGLPVICLDTGGPGQIVNDTCGKRISIGYNSQQDVIDEIVMNIQNLYNDRERISELRNGAVNRAKKFDWKNIVGSVYTIIENN